VRSASGLAAASTAGYLGFIAGPPLIGLIAELTSLRGGLGVVAACTALPLLLAGRAEFRARDASARPQGGRHTGGRHTSRRHGGPATARRAAACPRGAAHGPHALRASGDRTGRLR
jgi:MFS family permease